MEISLRVYMEFWSSRWRFPILLDIEVYFYLPLSIYNLFCLKQLLNTSSLILTNCSFHQSIDRASCSFESKLRSSCYIEDKCFAACPKVSWLYRLNIFAASSTLDHVQRYQRRKKVSEYISPQPHPMVAWELLEVGWAPKVGTMLVGPFQPVVFLSAFVLPFMSIQHYGCAQFGEPTTLHL